MTQIFAPTFQDNNLIGTHGFYDVVWKDGYMELVTPGLYNTYGLKITPGVVGLGVYGQMGTGVRLKRFRQAFYFNPNSVTLNTLTYLYIGANVYTNEPAYRLVYTNTAGVYQIMVGAVQDDNSNSYTSKYAIPSTTTTCIEVDWKASSAPGANDGTMALYINGNLMETKASIDNDTKWVGYPGIGNCNSAPAGWTASSYYFMDRWRGNDNGDLIETTPLYLSGSIGSINSTTPELIYSAPVYATNYATGWTFKANGSTIAISSAARQASTNVVRFVLASAPLPTDTVTAEYNSAVGNYYDVTSTYPMATLAAKTLVNNIVNVLNLEVPIEMVMFGVNSLSTGAYTMLRSAVNFDISNYDGTPACWFEIVVYNANATTAYNVTLRDITNSANLSAINVPAATAAGVRIRATSAFTPAAGNNKLEVVIDQTAVAGNVVLYSARIVVIQTAATKTRLQFPLLLGDTSSTDANGYVDTTASASYVQTVADRYGYFNKMVANWGATLSGWTLEGVMRASAGGATATVGLHDTASNLVTGGEITVTGTTVDIATANFASNAVNFTDNADFMVKLKSSTGTASFCSANLYLAITNLNKAEVHWMIGRSRAAGTAASNILHERAMIVTSNYTNPTVYWEATGYCADNAAVAKCYEHGTADSGTTSPTTKDSKNWNSATKARYRSAAFAITSGDRFWTRLEASTANQSLSGSFVVIDATV